MEQSSTREQDILSTVKDWQEESEKQMLDIRAHMLNFEARIINMLEDRFRDMAPPPSQDNDRTTTFSEIFTLTAPNVRPSEVPSTTTAVLNNGQLRLTTTDLPPYKTK